MALDAASLSGGIPRLIRFFRTFSQTYSQPRLLHLHLHLHLLLLLLLLLLRILLLLSIPNRILAFVRRHYFSPPLASNERSVRQRSEQEQEQVHAKQVRTIRMGRNCFMTKGTQH
jgi:hypothetical protein